ncbi:stage V sporulation protein AC [Paenibacillus apis]|uniref:Stage V sporulation protein AC n=1 Tax=Paenibacillus apis TaxID=1792174 RepID=A0A919Y3Y4_9BACL|nr:stage V sporulation protein AC [Paenibacillus apis]GIO41898.1 stage V sporulation protein AC [Paenibacillus apis]
MAKKKNKKLTPTQQQYQRLAADIEPKRPVVANCLKAFLSGGIICLLGECIRQAFVHFGGFSDKDAAGPMAAVLVIASVLLTSFGVYDKIAQWAGAGTAVPITGFANSMASSAIEHRPEGLVLGVAAGMFQLAGSVIVFGTFAAFIIGIIYAIFVPGYAGGH